MRKLCLALAILLFHAIQGSTSYALVSAPGMSLRGGMDVLLVGFHHLCSTQW